MKKIYLKVAGILNLLTAFIHLIAGQVDMVNPLMNSNIGRQLTAEWIAAWHIVTILLFMTSYVLLKIGFFKQELGFEILVRFIAMLYILAGLAFVISSACFSVFAPQWILLMPIGVLILLRKKKAMEDE